MIKTSKGTGEIVKAFAAYFEEEIRVRRNASNPFHKSTYADLGEIVSSIKPALIRHGLRFTQAPSFRIEEGVGIVSVETVILHISGEWFSSVISAPTVKQDPQGVGSAITYCRRYGLSAMLGIVSEEDDDGNYASSYQPKNGNSKTALDKERKKFSLIKNKADLREYAKRLPSRLKMELMEEISTYANTLPETSEERVMVKPSVNNQQVKQDILY